MRLPSIPIRPFSRIFAKLWIMSVVFYIRSLTFVYFPIIVATYVVLKIRLNDNSYHNSTVESKIKLPWNWIWKIANMTTNIRLTGDDIFQKSPANSLDRKHQSILARLRIGHTNFARVYLIVKEEPNKRNICKEKNYCKTPINRNFQIERQQCNQLTFLRLINLAAKKQDHSQCLAHVISIKTIQYKHCTYLWPDNSTLS